MRLISDVVQQGIIYEILTQEATRLISGECVLTPTILQHDPTAVVQVKFFDDPGCSVPHNGMADNFEFRASVGSCIALPSMQASMKVFCGRDSDVDAGHVLIRAYGNTKCSFPS